MKRILILALFLAPLSVFGMNFTTPSGAIVDELGNLIAPPPFVWRPQETLYFRVIFEPIIPTPKPILKPHKQQTCESYIMNGRGKVLRYLADYCNEA